MPRTFQSPPVVHMVADLDDLGFAAPRRRSSLVGRLASLMRRVRAHRRLASYATVFALLSAVIACSDSTDPLTPARPAVARVGVTPTTAVLETGETRTLTVMAFDANDNILAGRTAEFSSDAPMVVSVSSAGVVTALARGYAGIKATVEGKSTWMTVTVVEPEPSEAFDLVYERRPFNVGGDIRRLSLAGGASTILSLVSPIPGAYMRDVAPSPDGLRVAFTIAWDSDAWPTIIDGDIYVANIDGSGVQRLTSAPYLDEQPAWSPDGSRIVFRSTRRGEPDIFVMGADGSSPVNLTADFQPGIHLDHTPSWSPDGSRIVFASDVGRPSYPTLWTMRADGTDKRRLLPQAASTDIDVEPSWSPDGTRIAFRRTTPDGGDIVILTIATGQETRLALAGKQAFPSWSPDGSRIAYTSSQVGMVTHIFTVNPDGSDAVQHTTNADENTYPRWLRVR